MIIRSLILCLLFNLTGCFNDHFDSDEKYTVKNPFGFHNYDFNSFQYKNFDSKILSYYKETNLKPTGTYYLVDVNHRYIRDNFDIILDFDNLTYTIYDKKYPKPVIDYSPDSNQESFEEEQMKHKKSTSKGRISVQGSVVYFDFTDNQHLKNPEQTENFIPSIVINEEFFKFDIDDKNKNYFKLHFLNHFYSQNNKTSYFYFTFERK